MAKAFAKPFYNSKEWKKCRLSYIAERQKIDGGVCERCGDEVGSEVHHTIELTPENITNPEITLNHALLELLGHNCHTREHRLGEQEAPRCTFDANGQPVPLPPSESVCTA